MKFSLKNVEYSVTDSVGVSLTVDHIRVSTPDPSQENAPYTDGSVKIAKKPAGWRAGHNSTTPGHPTAASS